MLINFTFWKSRRSWYCFIKNLVFASVKKVTPLLTFFVQYNYVFLPCFWFKILRWMVLSMSSLWHQHPLRTLRQISYMYAHVQSMKGTQCPWCNQLCMLVYLFFVWIFMCFWIWHRIGNCTYARFVTCGTLKVGTNQQTNYNRD